MYSKTKLILPLILVASFALQFATTNAWADYSKIFLPAASCDWDEDMGAAVSLGGTAISNYSTSRYLDIYCAIPAVEMRDVNGMVFGLRDSSIRYAKITAIGKDAARSGLVRARAIQVSTSDPSQYSICSQTSTSNPQTQTAMLPANACSPLGVVTVKVSLPPRDLWMPSQFMGIKVQKGRESTGW